MVHFKGAIAGRLSDFLQYVAGMLLGTTKGAAAQASAAESNGGGSSGGGSGGEGGGGGGGGGGAIVFRFMDTIIQQLYLGIEASSTPDSADSAIREFMVGKLITHSILDQAIYFLSMSTIGLLHHTCNTL